MIYRVFTYDTGYSKKISELLETAVQTSNQCLAECLKIGGLEFVDTGSSRVHIAQTKSKKTLCGKSVRAEVPADLLEGYLSCRRCECEVLKYLGVWLVDGRK